MEQVKLVAVEVRKPFPADLLRLCPSEIADGIRQRVKILLVADVELANRIEATGLYYVDRYSESRDKVVLMRRDRSR